MILEGCYFLHLCFKSFVWFSFSVLLPPHHHPLIEETRQLPNLSIIHHLGVLLLLGLRGILLLTEGDHVIF